MTKTIRSRLIQKAESALKNLLLSTKLLMITIMKVERNSSVEQIHIVWTSCGCIRKFICFNKIIIIMLNPVQTMTSECFAIHALCRQYVYVKNVLPFCFVYRIFESPCTRKMWEGMTNWLFSSASGINFPSPLIIQGKIPTASCLRRSVAGGGERVSKKLTYPSASFISSGFPGEKEEKLYAHTLCLAWI